MTHRAVKGGDGILCWITWLLLVLLPLIGVTGCKKSRTVSSPRMPPGPVRLTQEPRIRILLAENFQPFEVEGEERADRLRIEWIKQEIRLFEVKGGGGTELGRGSGFRLVPRSECLTLFGKCYRGVVDVFINPLGRPVLVNDLPIEDYLRGVVPRELGPRKYPEIEALKAQSVAARTFAIGELGRNADKGFDLFPDVRSQAYGGHDSEEVLSNRAVRETRGVVAAFEDRPIVSLYCSTCGGVTESFHLIFKGGPIAYLQGGASCSDQSSPYHYWNESIDLATRSSEIARYTGFREVTELEILSRSPVGRVIRMRFKGLDSEKVLEGNDLRFALGLRSNWILSLETEAATSGIIKRIRVSGKGWGHGVGLCQIGAVEMARSGRSYAEIMKHYYQGVELRTWYP